MPYTKRDWLAVALALPWYFCCLARDYVRQGLVWLHYWRTGWGMR